MAELLFMLVFGGAALVFSLVIVGFVVQLLIVAPVGALLGCHDEDTPVSEQALEKPLNEPMRASPAFQLDDAIL